MYSLNKSIYPLGLDISDLSLKLVQLNKIRDKIKIQAIGKINLPPGIIESGEIKNKPELINAIKKLTSSPKYGKVSSDEVTVCLPESKTFIKLIEVAKSPNSLSEVIGTEIEKHVPMSINEIYYDWQVIENKAEKYQVLIGAAPKNIVNQYTELLDEAKLFPVALEIEPMAICRGLLVEESPSFKKTKKFSNFKSTPEKIKAKNYALIDIGACHTSMIFYAHKTILFTVSIPITGEQITASIAQTLEISKEQAEKAKIVCGLDENKAQGIIKNILEEVIKKLIKKINEAIQFYQSHYAESGPLEEILICGGGANIKNLTDILKEATSTPVRLADALINLAEAKEKFTEILAEKHLFEINLIQKNSRQKNKTLAISQNSSLTFTTAIGLALRGIFIDELLIS